MTQTHDEARSRTCEEVRPLIDRFAERTLTADEATAMRAHLVGCADCAQYYRTSIESAGRSGAAARELRERREADQAHERRVRESVEGQQEPKRYRNWRLRTLLMPAFFAFLIFQIFKAQDRGPRFVVDGAIGEVEVTGRPIESYGENEIVLRRGSRCVTGEDSSVRIMTGGFPFEVGARTELLIVDFDPPRTRLFVGELSVAGPCVIETLLGNVVVEGETARGRVLVDVNGLLVVADDGAWTFRNADGEESIAPGGSQRFRP